MLANCSLVLIAALLFFLLFSPSFSQSIQSDSGGIVISSESQLLEDITLAPCKNQSRLSAVESLFEKLGAPPAELAIEKLDGVENLTLKVAGKSSEIILVGAHYDKVQNGCGAVDNWSGIVAIGHIYHSLKNLHLNKTIIFVAFGREEEGLLGSKAMAKRIEKTQTSQYCAMVNIDSLGLGAPQVATNFSSQKLTLRAEELARAMEMPFAKGPINSADSDSSSFINRKIPALTIHGLAGDFAHILHSDKDKAEKVNPQSLYLGYRLALALIYRLDEAACDASRD